MAWKSDAYKGRSRDSVVLTKQDLLDAIEEDLME
jgi:hypothetical protein